MAAGNLRKYLSILMPDWIFKQIQKNHSSLSVVFDLSKLAAFLSMEDLCLLYCLNSSHVYQEQIFGLNPLDRYRPVKASGPSLTDLWLRSDYPTYEKIKQHAPLYEKHVDSRLFVQHVTPTAPSHLVAVSSNQQPITALVIVIHPGQFQGEDQRNQQNRLVREYMRQLYAFADYAVLARDPLYKRYLDCVTSADVGHAA